MRKLSLLALILGGFGLAACRDSGGSSSGDDVAGSDSGGNTDDVKIQDIQNDAMASGTAVKLKGVIVTAVDKYGGKTGDFWVQEPEGGEYSGIHVFGAPLDQVAALTPGAVVDIDGAEKDEFVYQGNNGSGGFQDGYGITELKPVGGGVMTVTPTGAMMTLQPHVVDAAAIGQMPSYMDRDAEWEKWEGVLISVNNVTALSSEDCVSKDSMTGMCKDDTFLKFDITGGAVVESGLAAMPATSVESGDCLSSVTGVVDYFFDYQILPRTTAEIGTGGSGCPTMNIAGIQSGAISGPVVLDAYIVALDNAGKHLWIADSLDAAVNEGVYVYRGSTATMLDNTFVPGAQVHVSGNVDENNNDANGDTLTEIKNATITVTAAPNGTPTPLDVADVAPLVDPVTGEPYESVLVKLTNVGIETAADSMYHVGSMNQGGTIFTFDDGIFQLAAETNTSKCYAEITGIWFYNVYSNDWVFYPIDDGMNGSGC